MITLAELATLEASLKFALQKVTATETSIVYVHHAVHVEHAKADAARQYRILYGVAGELQDVIGRLPEPAAINTAGA